MKLKKDLLDVLRGLCKIENDIREYFGDFEQLSSLISDLSEIILEQYMVENSDLNFEQLMNFGDGEITKEKLLKKYFKK